jgi:hypothetical protein
MKAIILSIMACSAFGLISVASAEPVKLSKEQMAAITAGAITQTNGGGNIPGGNANGVPATNPAGSAPPGHNK